ncbi:MAG: TraR/DksA C4-type zinc finger protein [Patescibacteria group bacterium]|nr:TraR/DksA C4-type zinc finger protein [Patescibacteria group bacterium]
MTSPKTTINPQIIKEMESLLIEQKTRLEEDLEKFAKKDPHVASEYETSYSEYGDDVDENTQEVTEYLANKPVEMQLEKELKDVVKALASIKAGNYGICKYCKQPIEEKRLRARPTSGACVSCKKTITQEL